MAMITENGVYDIAIEEYHHDPKLCDGPSVSSSALRTMMTETPAHYWAYSPLNPNRFPDESTKALDIGKAAHCLTLGEPEFAKYFVVSPFDDFRKGEARAWRDAETRTILKAHEFEEVQILAAVQKRSAQCMRAFQEGEPEKSLVWKDEETGIWLKARPDWLPRDPAKRFTTEFKTALTIEPNKMSNAAFAYGYHLQVALIVDGIREVMGVDPIGVALVCQEKAPPYLVELRLFTPEQIEDGRQQYRHALKIFADCLKRNDWPGYTTEPTYFSTPYSHAMRMENLANEQHRYARTPDRKSLDTANVFNAG